MEYVEFLHLCHVVNQRPGHDWKAQVKTHLCQTLLTPCNPNSGVELHKHLMLFTTGPHRCLDVTDLERLKEKTLEKAGKVPHVIEDRSRAVPAWRTGLTPQGKMAILKMQADSFCHCH